MLDDCEEDYCDASDCDGCDDDDCAPIRVPPPRPGGTWVPNFGRQEDVRLAVSETALALSGESDVVIIPNIREMTLQEKIIVKSLGLAYVRPYGGRCTSEGCEKRASWFEPATRSWGCTLDHIKGQLKEASAERTGKEKKKQTLSEYLERIRCDDPEDSNNYYWTTAGTGEYTQASARIGGTTFAMRRMPSRAEEDAMETAIRRVLEERPHLRGRILDAYPGDLAAWVEVAGRIIAEDDGADRPSSPNNS